MAKKGRNGTRRGGFLAIGVLIVLAMGAGAAGIAVGAWNNVCLDCPSIAQLYTWEPKQSTRILSHDGRVIAELAQQRRTPVDIDDLPAYVPQAFIAVEDKRFYTHPGFDILGYMRAARNLVLQRRIAGGGSTITVQLARHMFIEEIGFDQSFRRKLKELHVALDLEQVYSKDQILQAYINQINYGHGWYGIESAAQNYFGKPAAQLDPAEAALLAAVVNLPGRYSPLVNPEAAESRRNLVLRLMGEQGYLTPEEAVAWRRAPVPTTRAEPGHGDLAPYFVEWVRSELDDRFGPDLYTKGYRIYTTLDVDMQRIASSAMQEGYARIENDTAFHHLTYQAYLAADDSLLAEIHPDTAYIQGMFLAMDPWTGEVKAMIGGRDFQRSKFNRATQARRQPGSVFKPFVYTAALAGGIPASHVIYDTPVTLDQPDGSKWSPRNYTFDFKGPMTLREALRRSINVVAVKTGMEVGIETVAQYAQRMGVKTPIPRVPSTAIGAADVIPIDIAEAYTTFANMGIKVRPRGILRVQDADGTVVMETQPERERILDEQVSFILLDMMRDVVDRGSGYAVRDPNRGAVPYALPAAGKTGTTNDFSDVWFMGFSPDLLAGAWFGFDLPITITQNAAGGSLAAPVWARFMKTVYYGPDPDTLGLDTLAAVEEAPSPEDSLAMSMLADEPVGPLRALPAPWIIPEGLVIRKVDDESGKLATEFCPGEFTYWEVFLPGTEPTELCDLHGPGLFGAPLRGIEMPPDTAAGDTIPIDSLIPLRYRRPPEDVAGQRRDSIPPGLEPPPPS